MSNESSASGTIVPVNEVVTDVTVDRNVRRALNENCFVVPLASLPKRNSVPSMLPSVVYVLINAMYIFYLQLFFLVPLP